MENNSKFQNPRTPFFPVGIGIWNSALGIRNPANNWNPESKFHRLEKGTGIHGTTTVLDYYA